MKLTYFNLQAKAEPIRLLLNHAKVPFVDQRLSFAEFGKLKKSKDPILPNGQVPVFEDNGIHLHQHVPILRYLGIKYGYYSPSDALEAYQADLPIATIEDHGWKPFSSILMSPKAASAEDIEASVER